MRRAISGVCRRWNPSIECGYRHSKIAGYVFRRNTTGEQLLRRLDLAFRHLPFPAAHSPELASNFESCTSSFDGEFPFHLSQARHHVEEEAARGGTRVNRVGQTPELDALLLELADQID